MGRCNNRRVQQAAQASKNIPSRARFSKPPPKKNTGGRRRGESEIGGRGESGRGRGGESSYGRGRGGPKSSAAVINKLSKRVHENQTDPLASSSRIRASSSRRRHSPLDGVDISKLDEITLSETSIQVVTKLLTDLNVMESTEPKEGQNLRNEEVNDDDEEPFGDNDDDDDDAIFDQQQQFAKGCGYSEYEDDFEESENETPAAHIPEYEGGEGDDNDESDDDEQVRQTPLFLHLTAHLSFSEEHAMRAYRAIDNWQVPSNTAETNQTSDALDDDQLALAMDWLCLHLTDAELKAGFRPSSNTRRLLTPLRGIILAGTGRTRAIPHASISVAKPITDDQEWRDTVRRQSRKVGFLRLGFLHAEAEKACDDTMHVSEKVSTEEDEDGLRVMLSMLEKETLGESFVFEESSNQTDLDYAKSEREQEIQALEAIFDDQFKVRHREGFDRYLLSVVPVEDLRRPGHSEECKLHVFVRPGYPVLSPPLLLFTNPTLPPSLLRRINTSLVQKAYENIGEPSIFAVMDFLSNKLHEMQIDFIKEQRSKEMEADQLRIRREADYDVDEVTVAQHENGEKIGRRQKAKLRAAEKSLDRLEQSQREEIQRRQRQEERLERVKSEQNSLRLTMAERALKQRAQQRIAEEAEQAYRKAMNDAFNQGESAEEARAAARKARKESLRHNGEDVSSSEDERDADNVALKDGPHQPQAMTQDNGGDEEATIDELVLVEPKQTPPTSRATPATMAFMERLRQCYNNEAREKSRHSQSKNLAVQGNREAQEDGSAKDTVEAAKYHFEDPIEASGWETAHASKTHVPMPVPVPTLDLKDVMKDLIKAQNEQPWLISPEARVPTVSSKEPELTPKQTTQRNAINKRLRDELTRKNEAADVWAKNNSASPTTNGKGQFHMMRLQRQRLPAYMMKDEIVETIALHQITVISGDTGCGKTTQVPQLVLDDMIMKGSGAEANMVVTQPRRISAIGVSHRIASERGERIGETAGYSIRMENKLSSKTRLLLCTTGILLRRLQCDPDLASVSHVFVDEVHERDLNTDFLLIVLKDLLARRKSLKLVLMSATLNATTFSDYFGGCPVVSIPGRTFPVLEQRLEDILQLTGYEVQEHSEFALKTSESRPAKFSKSTLRKRYYPKYNSSVIGSLSIIDESKINYELIAELVEHIALNNEQGAILIFLPGMMEITKAIEELYKKEIFQSSKVVIYPLHSSLSTAEQTAIFEVPPEGVRKIVVATNIAETSITIEDVVYVVDSGRVKENRRDVINDMSTLVETWVSRASAKQRRGRAGRVRDGIAYHLFSSHTFDDEMEDYQLPEMLRVGLEDLVLSILLLDLGEPSSFLAKAVNPPSAMAMRNSLKLLEGLGAVEVDWKGHDNDRNDETIASQKDTEGTDAPSCGAVSAEIELTALGFHLATLPVDPRVGKMMIYGALFQCTDPALTIAASMSARSPFVSPFDKRDEADTARKKFAIGGSDHLTTLNAFNMWKAMRRNKGERETQTFLRESFLSRLTLFQMEDLRKQFSDLLVDVGFLPKEFRLKGGRRRDGRGSDGSDAPRSSADAYSDNIPLIKAILCAGLYPNIIVAPRSLVRKDGIISDKEAGECAFQSLKGEVYLHPCTISFSEKRLDSRYCCYHEIVKTSKTYVRDCTTVSEIALLLFGGSLMVYHTHGVVTVDGWLKFKISPKAAALVKHLRAQMESMLLKKIVSPEEDITGSDEAKGLIQAVSALFAQEINTLPESTGAEIVRPWKGGKGGEKKSTESRKNGGGRSASRGGRGARSGRGRGRGSNR